MSEQRTKLMTPKGHAIWPRLNEPDRRWKPEGEYKVTLRLRMDEPGVSEFIDGLQKQFDAHVEAAKKELKKGTKAKIVDPPWKPVKNDNGDDTGEIDVKFALRATVTPQKGEPFTQKVALFDAKGKPTNVVVGSGSVIKVAGKLHPWSTPIGIGVSLWLNAVQVLDRKAPGQDATAYGFGEEEGFSQEDGFEPAADANPTTVEKIPGAKADDKDGDF